MAVDGDGINQSNPLAALHVKGEANGSTHVEDDLVIDDVTVSGQLVAKSDSKQDFNNNGMNKFLVKFRCAEGSSSITSQTMAQPPVVRSALMMTPHTRVGCIFLLT